MPHGTCRPLASTVTAACWSAAPPDGDGATEGVGKLGGSPAASGSGSPNAQPATVSAAAAAMTTPSRRGCALTRHSLAAPPESRRKEIM